MDYLTSRRLCRKFTATNVSSAPKYVILPRLVSQVHMMAGQNVKTKYLIYQIPIKMLKQRATPNSSLHTELKDLFIKRVRKN